MKRETVYFETAGDDHTLETFALVKQRAAETGIRKVVLASTTGRTALRAAEYFTGTDIRLVVVPHQYGFSAEGNLFPPDAAETLRANGHQVHFGTMPFHTDGLFGSQTPAVVANFLRCFCEGVKVCYEITLMAADGGLARAGEPVIAVAGTGANADTALVMQASNTRKLSKLRVNEILCKPYHGYCPCGKRRPRAGRRGRPAKNSAGRFSAAIKNNPLSHPTGHDGNCLMPASGRIKARGPKPAGLSADMENVFVTSG